MAAAKSDSIDWSDWSGVDMDDFGQQPLVVQSGDNNSDLLHTIHQLMGNQTYRARKRGRPSIPTNPEARLVDVSHFPGKGEGKDHVCIVCNRKHSEYKASNNGATYQNNPFKRCKTIIMCKTCNVYLCSPKSCFVDYHSKAEYWK